MTIDRFYSFFVENFKINAMIFLFWRSIMNLKVDIIPLFPEVELLYGTSHSAAFDIRAVSLKEPLVLAPGESASLSAGFKMNVKNEFPTPVAALIVPRSGLGSKGINLSNTVGLIDEDYQGEVIVNIFNRSNSKETITINPGDRFAQMFFLPVLHADFNVVESFEHTTERGEGGFGSTGN